MTTYKDRSIRSQIEWLYRQVRYLLSVQGTIGGGAVSSVFTRTGAVIAQLGDYTASLISFTPYLTITSTETQSAIVELKDELDLKLHGVLDYNDLTTATTPISLVGGAGFTYLTNDEAGPFTNKSYLPVGVTDVWDSSTNEFDFSQLPLGSKVEIRLDLEITTISPNTQLDGALELAIGGTTYDIQWFDRFEKAAGVHPIIITSFIYIGDSNTRDNPAKFKIEADGDTNIQVNGWACYITLY